MALNQNYFWRYLATVGVVAIAYFGTAQFTLAMLGLGAEASPVWPPAGVALTALLLQNQQVWPGVFLGDFCFFQTLGTSWEFAFGSALGSTLQAIVGAILLRRVGLSPSLERLRDVLGLVIFAALLSPIVNATIDTVFGFLTGGIEWKNFGQNWWILWLGDSTGILVVTPLLLTWRAWFPSTPLPWKHQHQQIFEAVVCFSLLSSVSWIVFGSKTTVAIAQYPLEYLPFPLIVWAALRFRQGGAVLASLIVSSIAIWGAVQGEGPFAIKAFDINQAILLLQTFMMVVTITALVLAATVSERQLAEEKLRTTLERDRLLAEIALRIRQSLELDQILNTTVAEVRQLLQVDRVLIGLLYANGQGKIVAESVDPHWSSLLEWTPDDNLLHEVKTLFARGSVQVTDDTTQLQTGPGITEYYQRYSVRATLVVPLTLNNQLFGLLATHQCSRLRHWQPFEVDLLQQLATQVMIAIQQAQLYQQVQTLNSNLERQVEERTLQLQEKMQELQSLYELKDVFLQAVAHDLRTSIMGMLLVLKNLQNEPGENIPLSRSIVERMVQSSDRQLTLINALLEDYSSNGQQLVLHCERLSLSKLVDSIVEDLQPLFAKNHATLQNLIPEDLPAIVADPTQLQCVFKHLFTNALKHNPPGVCLTLKATFENEMIRCTIEDNGVGMSSKQCERLFKLYVRGLHTQHLTGIGLGSYLCRQIITAHGGEIGVTSSPGAGTTFWLTLPTGKVADFNSNPKFSVAQ